MIHWPREALGRTPRTRFKGCCKSATRVKSQRNSLQCLHGKRHTPSSRRAPQSLVILKLLALKA
eukprot:340258-Amphidinium_carterae.2